MNRTMARSRCAFGTWVWLALSVHHVPANAAQVPELVPDWTLEASDGTYVNFYQHSAKRPAVLLFWATWCPYCRALMPHVEKLRQEFAGRGVNFYALNIWEDGDPRAHMQDNGYGFYLLLAADEVAKNYGIKGTPGLIVVDKSRKTIYIRKSGASPTQVESDLRVVLNNVLK